MSERPNDRELLYSMYSTPIIEEAEVGRAIVDALAKDWVPFQQDSGLLVPRYLDGLQEEVRTSFHSIHLGVFADALYKRMLFNDNGVSDELDSQFELAKKIYASGSLKSARAYFEERGPLDMGGARMAYEQKVISAALQLTWKAETAEARELINAEVEDPQVAEAYILGLEHWLLKSSWHGRRFDRFVARTDRAFTPAGRLAMRAAFDHKVLRAALEDKDSGFAEGHRLIAEYASTPDAREAMLGHLAIKLAGGSPRSKYSEKYKPRSDGIREDIVRKRKQRQEQERRARWEEYESSARARREQYFAGRRERVIRPNADVYQEVLGRVDPSMYRTVQAIGKEKIELVVNKVRQMREAKPDISARDIYLHFHEQAQMHNPPEEVLEIAKTLSVLLGGNFSKEAKLPF